MILKVLFIQRKESYEGQYAPEALCCVDEYAEEENPTWFQDQCKKELEVVKNDIISSKIIEIDIDQSKIRKIL